MLTETDPLGRVWRWSWNVHGQLVSSQTPEQAAANRSTAYTYGVKGSPGQIQGQLRRKTASGEQTVIWTRNRLGQVSRVETLDGEGKLVVAYDYRYDIAHRLSSVTDSRGNKTLEYAWTPGGRLARVADSDGHVTSYAYDAVGRLATITAPNGQNISLTWDAAGRLTERRFESGLRTTFAWFEDGSLKQKRNLSGSTILSSHLYGLDAQGRRMSQAEALGGVTRNLSYSYDNLDRLISANDGVLETYSYDIWGNRRSKTRAGETRAYLYDAAHQLFAIRQGSDAGQRIGAATHNRDGQLTELCFVAGSGSVSEDCGSSTSVIDSIKLSWTSLGMMASATPPASAGGGNSSYEYDHEGRRLSVTNLVISQVLPPQTQMRRYWYDGDDIHAELDGTGDAGASPSAVYVHGAGIDEPLLRLTGATHSPSAQQSAYIADGLGSVIGLVNGGSLAASQRFDAWGKVVAASGAVPAFGYTGREPDATGLVYYRARYYHPEIGRFISKDPLGYAAGDVNFYAYVGNNPANYNDPTGEVANFVVGAIYGGIAGGVGGVITAGFSPDQTIGSTLKSWGLGLLAGAATGAVAPWLSNQAGAAAAAAGLARTVGTVTATAAVGGASSAAGQLSGNVAIGQPLGTNFSWGAVGGSAIGAPMAILPAKLVGSMAATAVGTNISWGSRSLTIATPTVQHTGSTFRALTEGAFGGVFEVGGQAIENMLVPDRASGGASSGGQTLQSFEQLASPSGAAGGYLLDPNQSNTGIMQSVYGK
ncbi:RHS repeat-associated core domain-containing protein [Methyloversatilis thermotolerans]|uniref:RHS repeat-associated core domain-containing protein n=1 Tax=Methyloversatilis thermotolerans TaxID=1346290 RepID=UPI000369C5A0